MEEVFSKPAEEFVNDQLVEELWAMKAHQHATIYFNLLSSVPDPAVLKLTPHDAEIYDKFRASFPDLPVKLVDEDQLKSPAAKEQWREFCNSFEATVQDFNYATLLRLDASEDYSAVNSTIVPRIQFLAIEIARNREHANDMIHETFKQSQSNQNVTES